MSKMSCQKNYEIFLIINKLSKRISVKKFVKRKSERRVNKLDKTIFKKFANRISVKKICYIQFCQKI